MGGNRPPLDKVSNAERRIRDNVIRRLHADPGPEELRKIESNFTRATYDLLTVRDKVFHSTPTIHPSEAGGCMLRMAFGLRGFERKPPSKPNPKMLLTFAIGKAIHEILQGKYHLLGGEVRFEDEIGISPETSPVAERYSITGHVDGRFTDLATGMTLGLEIKSMSGKRFSVLDITEYNKDQATLYMACLGLDFMVFVLVDKNNSNIECKIYKRDEERWKSLTEKLDNLMVQVMLGEEVPRTKEHFVCTTMCNYYWCCKPEG
jgi:hypothetical protein